MEIFTLLLVLKRLVSQSMKQMLFYCCCLRGFYLFRFLVFNGKVDCVDKVHCIVPLTKILLISFSVFRVTVVLCFIKMMLL